MEGWMVTTIGNENKPQVPDPTHTSFVSNMIPRVNLPIPPDHQPIIENRVGGIASPMLS